MFKIFKFLLFPIACFFYIALHAQQLPSNFNIDQLTDQQLIQFLGQANVSGLSEADIEAQAKAKGLSADQILKLKLRIQTLNQNLPLDTLSNKNDNYSERAKVLTKKPGNRESNQGLQVFGSELFENTNLTFEPNLNLATPNNYVIGINDEIIIDVFGYSESTKKFKVNSEGFLRYPNVGPIKVNGLTFEDARIKIRKELTKVYPGLATGNTSLQVSLGQIKSIRVTLIGEVKRSGTYTISSLSTIANALYASGGPNSIGSMRNIELLRNGNILVQFDLYDFLLKGDLRKNLALQDGDIIRVSSVVKKIAIQGAVKKPAFFELKEGEYLGDLLKYCGGFEDFARKNIIRINRFGNTSKELVSVMANQFNNFTLNSGDSLTVEELANSYNNRIIIDGSVYYPGTYSIAQIPTLKDLIQAARVKEIAYRERAMIRRLKSDFTSSIINFNVNDILNGKVNIQLEREDSIHIYDIDKLKELYTLTINGEVNRPGIYEFSENIKIQDLILMASGYKEGASKKILEVSRRLRQNFSEKDTTVYAIVTKIDLNNKSNVEDSLLNMQLQPFDIVSIRKNPAYLEQVTVKVSGEVLYPGFYTVNSKGETISDLIKRAGGLKVDAYSNGATLVRNTFQNSGDLNLTQQRINILKNVNSDSTKSDKYKNKFNNVKGTVGINLTEILEKPHSIGDLQIIDGDEITIPKRVETIQSFGAVYVPQKIIYKDGLSFKKAIIQSGGFLKSAEKNKCYVMYANGEVKSGTHFLFLHFYPELKAGAELYIPEKLKKNNTAEILSIGATAASVAGLIISLVYLIKK